MADERKIVIELHAVSGSSGANASKKGSSGASSGGETSLTNALQTIQHPINSLEKATLGKNVLVYEGYQQAKAWIKNVSTFQIHRYFNLTENYKAEQDLNNTLSVLDHIGKAGSSIISGALVGATVAGPWGAIAGAVVGTVSAVTNIFTDAYKAWDQQNRQIQQMNMQSSFQQVRLGLVDDGRGTLN